MMSLDKYATAGEKQVVVELVRLLLEAGYALTVFDGEEYTVDQSTSSSEVLDALATTGEDVIIADKEVDVAYNRMSFELLYGNAEDGSEVVADYSASDLTTADGFFNKAYEVIV